MRKLIKIREGDIIPPGAVYISSVQERDPSKATTHWETNTANPMNYAPVLSWIFGTEVMVQTTPVSTFHYYEIDVP